MAAGFLAWLVQVRVSNHWLLPTGCCQKAAAAHFATHATHSTVHPPLLYAPPPHTHRSSSCARRAAQWSRPSTSPPARPAAASRRPGRQASVLPLGAWCLRCWLLARARNAANARNVASSVVFDRHGSAGPSVASWRRMLSASQMPATAAPLHHTQVLTSSGLQASQIKHLAGGVYAYANSGMPMVSRCPGPAAQGPACITLLLRGAVTCGACQPWPAHGHRQVPACLCVRATRVCAMHCSTHPASQGDPCAAPMGSCLRRRSRSNRHLCANRANLSAERRVRRLWRWPHSSGGGKAQRRIYRQVNGMLIRHSPCTL